MICDSSSEDIHVRETVRRHSTDECQARNNVLRTGSNDTKESCLRVGAFRDLETPFKPIPCISTQCSGRFCSFGCPNSVVHRIRRSDNRMRDNRMKRTKNGDEHDCPSYVAAPCSCTSATEILLHASRGGRPVLSFFDACRAACGLCTDPAGS